ncbi:MAG TPA: hypothetical protein DD465_18890 [Thalassospira sp.]|nr:hypothetical protein [Thalassospira sp.]
MEMTIYFLDRNVVSLVKSVSEFGNCSGLIKKDNKKASKRNLNMIKKLRRQDKIKNIHTCVLSIVEGELGRPQNDVDMKKVAEKEIQSMGSFFKKSKTDVGALPFIQCNSGFFPKGLLEESADCVCSFLEFVSSEIYQPVSKKKLGDVRDKILIKAFNLNVDLKHPAVLLSIGALYGSKYASGVIKPSESNFNKYNAYNDIMIPFRISRFLFKDSSKWKFLTMDESLLSYVEKNLVSLNSASLFSSGKYVDYRVSENFSTFLDIKMFEEKLDEKEYKQILHILNNPYKHVGVEKIP